MTKRRVSSTSALWSMMETAHAATTTVAFRLPHFMAAALAPTSSSHREVRRAASEKVVAGMEGAVAATLAWQSLWVDAAFGRLTPNRMAGAMTEIAHAATRPADRCVRANAKRLTKRAKR